MNGRSRELFALEQLSARNTVVHRLHPTAKLLVTALFLLTVVSFDRYDFRRLVPFVFYPAVLMALSETPWAMLLKRTLAALPFCLMAGLANVWFDRTFALALGSLRITYGVVSLFTILLKTFLCVMAVLILAAVTPLPDITGAMRRLRMPRVFVTLFEMTYRYAGLLFDEAASMATAYSLRSAGAKGISMKDMGSFVGQLLLRSIDRAERVYNAMVCRGYAVDRLPQGRTSPARTDWSVVLLVGALCAVLRFVDVYALFM